MPMPNFFVLGAMKAGTTSLYRYLSQHPGVHMPEKEPGYFSREALASFAGPDGRMMRCDESAYRRLFEGASQGAVLGEATPYYLCDPVAAEGIRKAVPEAKLIVTLRQPVDRAFSAYLMKCRQGWETLGFEEALEEEPRRVAQRWSYSWHYMGLGRYGSQLERYRALFSREQVRVVLLDDLVSDPAATMRGIYRFLGIDDTFAPDVTTAHNKARMIRVPRLSRWINSPSRVRRGLKRFLPAKTARSLWEVASGLDTRWNLYEAPTLDAQLRARLTEQCGDEISRLEVILDRDLSVWRSV